MEKEILTKIGYILSCIVELWVAADFMNHRFQKKIINMWIHRGIYLLIGICVYCTNLLKIPVTNFLASIVVGLILGLFLYEDKHKSKLSVVFQGILITMLGAIGEVIGYFILFSLLKFFNISYHSNDIVDFFPTIGTLILMITVYRFMLYRILERERVEYVKSKEYVLYFIIMIFSIINIFILIPTVESIEMNLRGITILASGILLLFLNLYISDLIGYLSENNALKTKIALLDQRSILQEEHFIALDKRYEMALKVLHDVKKHIQVIDGLYKQKEGEKAITYTQDISEMLSPLMPVRYVSDHILNTILNDKITLGEEQDIHFDMEVENVSLTFMEQIDITALFGNLLDNALEACRHVTGEKVVRFSVKERNDMLFLRIENSREGDLLWNNQGLPVSRKGRGHGLGLVNIRHIVEKYQGDILLDAPDKWFICRISLKMQP